MTHVRELIRAGFNRIWREDHEEAPPVLEEDTVLLETGMDSMAFAVLVAELDDELGYDPFSMNEDAVYPSTFGEFVAFYQQHATPA
jgi:acyl carrier protein